MYDVIIIGGGPAGLTAALYSGRRALKTLVLTRDIGGQASKTFSVENYPGVKNVSGVDLSFTLKEQAENFGAKIQFEEVMSIGIEQDGFSVKTFHNEYQTKTIILAFGKQPRELNVPGEREFLGKGVSYCATCDAPFFKNKKVVVVGGGNSALNAVTLAAKISTQVYLIHRSELSGEQVLIDKIKAAKNVEIMLGEEISEIKGAETVKSIVLKSGKEIETDGIIVEIGSIVDLRLVEKLVKLNEKNQIEIDCDQNTSVPGIFAAGDLTDTKYKQIVISAGEGAKAALTCYDYIQRLGGKKGISGDWH
jgi:thioredoxin-disulfide reductase